MKPNILKSNLLNPGTKFIATSDVKDTTLPPSSTGFFSYFKNPDRDYQDVAYGAVSIIRRGKTGQERLESKEISFPVFIDKRMLEQDDYLPLGRRYYLHIEEEPINYESLIKAKPLEFLGWSHAYVMFLKHITNNFVYPAKRAKWSPETVDQILVDARRFTQQFSDDSRATLATYGQEEFRRSLILAIRKLESKLVKCICSYKKGAIASILNSAHFVDYTNEEHYEVTDKDLAKSTVSFYQEKHQKINALVEKNRINMDMKKGL